MTNITHKQNSLRKAIATATVTVSKRNFKRAVDRNKLKRRMREAYRRNKQMLIDTLNEKNKKIMTMICMRIESAISFEFQILAQSHD